MTADRALDVGDALRSLRRQRDLSQRELARRAGVPASTLARLESGQTTDPRLRTLERLARAAGGSVQIVAHGTAADGTAAHGPRAQQPPPPALVGPATPATDAAGRHYPAHLDVRATYPFVGRDRRVRPTGVPRYGYELDRATRDARRRREAAAARLPIQLFEDRAGQIQQWVIRSGDGALVGRLTAQRFPSDRPPAWYPPPQTLLCRVEVAPQWRDHGVGERLLAQLQAGLVGRVELVTVVHSGMPAQYARQLGFNHPAATVTLLATQSGM